LLDKGLTNSRISLSFGLQHASGSFYEFKRLIKKEVCMSDAPDEVGDVQSVEFTLYEKTSYYIPAF
jgi:hypothetical protein